jgi:4'-phosphopantetheinyl transferase
MQLLPWSLPLGHPCLYPDQVHVWRAVPALTPTQYQEHWQVLAPDERERAQRFCFAHDREAFVMARGVLRILLGRYLAVAPQELAFCYGPQGKPALMPSTHSLDLRFNISHTQGLILYAVAIARDVGIDIERVRSQLKVEALARRCFSPAENRWLQTLAGEERLQAFFQGWACKEALIKARGGSIFQDQEPPQPAEQGLGASLLPQSYCQCSREFKGVSGGWFCYSLAPGPGYAAALAVAGCPLEVQCWQWPSGEPPLV